MNGPLSCSAENCVHNMAGLCSANTIQVLGSNAHSSSLTQCGTFAEKGLKNAISNVFNMNIPGELRQAFTNSSIEMSPHIECDAVSCTYNIDKKCSADYIQIHGPGALTSARTQCQTFKQ